MANKGKQSFLDVLRGNIGVLTWTRFLFFFPMQMNSPYFSLYIKHLGGSPANIGFVTSMASLTSIIILPIGGYLGDFYGRVKLVASAVYFRSVAFLIYALSGSWVILAAGKFYEGLAHYYHGAQSAIIADSLRPGRRAMGLASLNTLPRAVAIVAPALGAYIITQFGLELGMRYLLCATFIALFFAALGRQKFLKETLRRDGSELTGPRRGVLSLIRAAYRSSWDALKWTPKSLIVFVLIHLLTAFSGSMVAPFWIIYAQEVIQLSVPEWGLILFIEGLFSLLISIPAGMLVDKLGNRRMIIIMLLCALFPIFLFVYCTTFSQTLAVMITTTLVNSFITPSCGAWLADMVPRQMRARVSSAYGRGGIGIRGGGGGGGWGFVMMIPAMLGSLAGGFIYSFNPAYPWFIHTGSLLISLIIALLFLKEPETPEV